MADDARSGSPVLAIGEGLARLIGFGTTVYLARTLGPEIYGVVAVAASVMLYLTQIVDSGVELAGMTDAAAGPERATAVVSGALAARLTTVAAVLLVVWPVGWWMMAQPDGRLLALYTLALPLTAVSVRWVYLGLQRPAPVAVSRIVADVVTGVVTVALVRSVSDVYRAPIATVIGVFVGTALLLRGLPRLGVRLFAPGDRPRVASMLARGRRLVLFTLLGLVLYNVDLLILRYLRGEADAGRYAAAYVLISFCANLMVAYAHTVLPSMAREPTPTAATAATYRSALVVAWLVTMPVAVGGALLAPLLIELLFGRAYNDGATALRVLVLSVPVAALRELAVSALIARHREPALLRVNIVAAVVNVSLNLAFIPAFGLAGAAWATVISEVVRLGVAVVAAREAIPGALPLAGFGRVLAAGLGMGLAVVASGTSGSLAAIVVGGVAYPLLLVLFSAVSLGGPDGVRVRG